MSNARQRAKQLTINGVIPSRNCVLNQEAVSQGQSTRAGMSSTIYTGDGANQSIVTGVDMATGDFGGLMWVKSRSAIGNHVLADSVRGANSQLYSDLTNAELVAAGAIETLTATGATLGNNATVNTNAVTYAAWSWQTNQKIAPAYGSELLTNGTFDTDNSGWTAANATINQNAGVVELRDAGTYTKLFQAVTTVVGETYMFTADVTAYSGTHEIHLGVSDALPDGTASFENFYEVAAPAVQTYKFAFVATATTTYIGIQLNGTTSTVDIDNLSVKQATTIALTNRGKEYTCHYNTDLGFSIVGYEGDGLTGHEIPHHLGVSPELIIHKNRDITQNWYAWTDDWRAYLNLDSAAVANTIFNKDENIFRFSATANAGNNSGEAHIAYAFSSVPGVSKVGKYIGTGAVGNYVDCGFKAGWVMLKNLTTGATDWVIFDKIRGDTKWLLPAQSGAEGTNAVMAGLFTSDNGFVVNEVSAAYNTLNDEFLFLAFAETANDATKLWTDYDYATTQDTLTIEQNSLISFAKGFDALGQIDTQEQVGAGITHTFGATHENKKYWFYKDMAGAYGVSEYRPLVGITRDDADKWGEVSPSDVTLRTTGKHFDYESATGVALASGEDGGGIAYEAFNKNSNDIISSLAWAVASTTTSWLQYKQTEKRVLKSWRMRENVDATQIPKRFTIEGSNDGFTWVAIDSTYTASDYVGAGASLWGTLHTTAGNTTAYLYHRINSTLNNGHATYTAIAELEFNTILPSDYYLVNDGKMYEYLGTDKVINGVFATDTDWTKGTGWTIASGVSASTGSAGASLSQNVALVAGERYQISIDIPAYTSGDLQIRQYNGAYTVITTLAVTGTHTYDFTALSGTNGYVYLTAKSGSAFIGSVDNVTVKRIDLGKSISRVYLAELMTNDDGEVSWFKNLPVAQIKGEDAEFQGDLIVHGELKHALAATGRVLVDCTQNPPLINHSEGVLDVVDLGVGIFKVVGDGSFDMRNVLCLTSVDENTSGSGLVTINERKGSRTIDTIEFETAYVTSTVNRTNQDSLSVNIIFFGGK